jgi:hypothetical protein
MKGDGAVDSMGFDIRSRANDEANRLEQFGFGDSGRSGMIQSGTQAPQVDNLTRFSMAYCHRCNLLANMIPIDEARLLLPLRIQCNASDGNPNLLREMAGGSASIP